MSHDDAPNCNDSGSPSKINSLKKIPKTYTKVTDFSTLNFFWLYFQTVPSVMLGVSQDNDNTYNSSLTYTYQLITKRNI